MSKLESKEKEIIKLMGEIERKQKNISEIRKSHNPFLTQLKSQGNLRRNNKGLISNTESEYSGYPLEDISQQSKHILERVNAI